MIYESERKMTYKEQEAYDLGYLNGKRAAMRSPWVKTSDRLPTEADADNTMCWVLATTISSNLPMPEAIAYIRANPDRYPYWMPIPPFPEVEE